MFNISKVILPFALVLLLASPAWGALAQVQQFGAYQGSSGVGSLATSSVTMTAGNLIVCQESHAVTTKTITSVADTLGNTYTAAMTQTDNATLNYSMNTYYAYNINSGTSAITFTYSTSTGFIRLHCQEISGSTTTDPLDQTNSATGSDANLNSGNVTTSQADEILMGYGIETHGNPTIAAGWTQGITENSEYDEYKIVSSASTYAATYTSSGSGQWIAQISTYKAAGGGGGGGTSNNLMLLGVGP